MSLFSKASGILGMNARNLLFLSRYNSRTNRRLADDKLFTKRFLQARGIGVAKLFSVVRTPAELRAFDTSTLPARFIVKPNRGYGGEGIIAIHNRTGNKFIDPSGHAYSWDDLFEHCLGILDGRYAVSGLSDTVLFEELLIPHDYFRTLSPSGLPDIRIIVFKYVPVIAMLRLPTPQSNGKANLHLGAVGVGIDIGTGKANYAVQYNTLIRKLPNGESIRNICVPQWHDILLTAAKTQYHSQIGYLAVDIALAKTGVKILELNARAGLAIQISNQAMLRKRLEKVADLKVASPTEGVRLGQSLFTRVVADKATMAPKTSTKPIIGLYEQVQVLNAPGATTLAAKIDPHAEETIISPHITLSDGAKLLALGIKDKKIRIPFRRGDMPSDQYRMIIAGKYLTEFLIDTTKKSVPQKPTTPPLTPSTEKIINNIDQKIATINEQLHVLAYLKPTNLKDAYTTFMRSPDHSPQFIYKPIDPAIGQLKKELKKIPRGVDHPLAQLYQEKIEELMKKISLIQSAGTEDVSEWSAALYGTVTERDYRQALSFIKQTPLVDDTSKLIKTDDVVKHITDYLAEKKLSKWKIKLSDSTTAGMQVTKNNTIIIDKDARITRNRLRALVAHEIETHIFRLENGRLQKYRIFEHGTAGYLRIEEGLAIYNQNRLNISLGAKYFTPAHNVVAIYLGNQLSFVDLYHQLVDIYGLDRERAWRTCIRVKRGLSDTGKPGVFTKDAAYFLGWQDVERLVRERGPEEIKKLYVGKIKIGDLQYITDFREWPIKFFPE